MSKVSLTKVKLNRWGKPLRFSDSVSANCVLGVHTGFPTLRGVRAYTDACNGVTTRMGQPRHCACACHIEVSDDDGVTWSSYPAERI